MVPRVCFHSKIPLDFMSPVLLLCVCPILGRSTYWGRRGRLDSNPEIQDWIFSTFLLVVFALQPSQYGLTGRLVPGWKTTDSCRLSMRRWTLTRPATTKTRMLGRRVRYIISRAATRPVSCRLVRTRRKTDSLILICGVHCRQHTSRQPKRWSRSGEPWIG